MRAHRTIWARWWRISVCLLPVAFSLSIAYMLIVIKNQFCEVFLPHDNEISALFLPLAKAKSIFSSEPYGTLTESIFHVDNSVIFRRGSETRRRLCSHPCFHIFISFILSSTRHSARGEGRFSSEILSRAANLFVFVIIINICAMCPIRHFTVARYCAILQRFWLAF